MSELEFYRTSGLLQAEEKQRLLNAKTKEEFLEIINELSKQEHLLSQDIIDKGRVTFYAIGVEAALHLVRLRGPSPVGTIEPNEKQKLLNTKTGEEFGVVLREVFKGYEKVSVMEMGEEITVHMCFLNGNYYMTHTGNRIDFFPKKKSPD